MPNPASRPPKATVTSFRDDSLYPRIEKAVAAILATGKVVAPVNVLVGMGLLAPEKLDAWRQGRVDYLERVINCNLSRLSRLLRIFRFHAHDANLVPSVTAYLRRGRGPRQRLRFTKTGEPKLEEAYATHFVWPGKDQCRRSGVHLGHHNPRTVRPSSYSSETGKGAESTKR